jgi:hypothetical protein
MKGLALFSVIFTISCAVSIIILDRPATVQGLLGMVIGSVIGAAIWMKLDEPKI